MGQHSVPRDQFYLLQATAAYHLAAADAAKSEVLSEEGFKLIQRSQNSRTAAALAQMAARFASGTGALSLLLRERQDLMREWRAVDTRLTLALSLPPEQRDTAGEAALREHLDRMSGRAGTIDAELARDFPDYAGLADPKPLTIMLFKDYSPHGKSW